MNREITEDEADEIHNVLRNLHKDQITVDQGLSDIYDILRKAAPSDVVHRFREFKGTTGCVAECDECKLGNPEMAITEHWSKVTCPDCLKHKPEADAISERNLAGEGKCLGFEHHDYRYDHEQDGMFCSQCREPQPWDKPASDTGDGWEAYEVRDHGYATAPIEIPMGKTRIVSMRRVKQENGDGE